MYKKAQDRENSMVFAGIVIIEEGILLQILWKREGVV
jgi:hypothetical protein